VTAWWGLSWRTKPPGSAVGQFGPDPDATSNPDFESYFLDLPINC
jgi:hypothetical protein